MDHFLGAATIHLGHRLISFCCFRGGLLAFFSEFGGKRGVAERCDTALFCEGQPCEGVLPVLSTASWDAFLWP